MRLASAWRDGVLPETGGVGQQAAFTVAAIEIITATWARMQAALAESRKE